MISGRIFNRIISLVVSAMVTCSFLATAADPAPTPAVSDAPASPNAKPPISDAQFKKIVDDTALHGDVMQLAGGVAAALGAIAQDEKINARADVYRNRGTGLVYGFIKPERGSGYLIYIGTEKLSNNFYVDKDRNLIAAIAWNENKKVKPTPIPKAEAQKLLDEQWVYWANRADHLSDTAPKTK